MKTILTIIFLIASQYGEAQDTIYFPTYWGKVKDKKNVEVVSYPLPELTDTLLVMIVYVDTGKWKARGDAGTKTFVEENVKWMSGYSVRKWNATEVPYDRDYGLSYQTEPIGWVHFKYLDILKSPLGENILVWLSK